VVAHHDALFDPQIPGGVLDRSLVAAVFGLGVSLRLHERALILHEERDRRHVQRAILAHALNEVGGNRDRLGVELLLHVTLRSNRADALEVAGPRAKPEPIEDVDNPIVL